MARFELISPYPPEECLHRLQDALTPANEVDIRTAYRWVQLAEKPLVRNSFKTFLRATLTEYENGTRIRGALGFHPFTKWFSVVWLSFAVLMGVIAAARSAPVESLLVCLGVAAVGLVALWFFRWVSRGQDRRLMQFVTTALDAKPLAETPAAK